MRCALYLFVGLWCTAAAAAEPWSRVERELAFESVALGGPLRFALLCPLEPAATSAGYPVVYLLHGLGGNHADWLEGGRIEATYDRLRREDAIPPLFVVMPDGGDGWYVNSAAIGGPGDYGRAVGTELVGHVDATLPTEASRTARAVVGLSMGGYGALRLAFTHSDRFAAAASLSGAILPNFDPERTPSTEEIWFLKDAFGVPFDPARFNALNLFGLIPKAEPAPPAVFLTSGDDDELGFHRGTMRLFIDLEAAGVPVELRITDGGHDWALWAEQIEPALRFFADVFATGR